MEEQNQLQSSDMSIYQRMKAKFTDKSDASILNNNKDVSGPVMLIISLIIVGILIVIGGFFFFSSSQVNKVRDYLTLSIDEINKINSLNYDATFGNPEDLVSVDNVKTIEDSAKTIPSNVNKDTETYTAYLDEYYKDSKDLQIYLKESAVKEETPANFSAKNNVLQDLLQKLRGERSNIISLYKLKDIPEIKNI